VGSIAASLLAAIALIAGSRRAGARRGGGRAASERDEVEVDDREPVGAARAARRHASRDMPTELLRTDRNGAGERHRDGGFGDPREASSREDARHDEEVQPTGRRMQTVVEPAIPAQGTAPDLDRGRAASQHAAVDDDDEYDEEDPADEPGAQQVSPADSARVARLSTDVLVIDGRPRYHLAGCVHLLGRESEPLPVAEAIELGFTPCGLCEPDSALLAEARRV
jgi:hypothetical protein